MLRRPQHGKHADEQNADRRNHVAGDIGQHGAASRVGGKPFGEIAHRPAFIVA
jgi:hypothetical protein